MSSGLGPILYLPFGATGRFRGVFARADGTAVVLTGATAITFTLKRNAYLPDASAALTLTVGSGVTVVDAILGIVEFAITAAQSATLSRHGGYFYYASATLASGEVMIPDLMRGDFYVDQTASLNQAANGSALVRVDPPVGTIAAITLDMANYLLNRYDLTGLTGGASTDLDGLTAGTLASLANGARLVLGLTGDIRAEYQIGAIGSDVEDAHGWVVVCDNDTTRAWRLVTGSVSKQGQPCVWNPTQSKWHQVSASGAAAAETSQLGPAFSLPL